MRATYTYAILEISASAYREIRDKLQAAGYTDQFHKDGSREVIDMHGIAVEASALPQAENPSTLVNGGLSLGARLSTEKENL